MGLVSVGKCDIISPVLGESFFIISCDLFMAYHLFKGAKVRQIVDMIDAFVKREILGVRGRHIAFVVYVDRRLKERCGNFRMPRKGEWIIASIKNYYIESTVRNASIVSKAVIYV